MSEEEKAIKRLGEMTINYKLNSEDLHYAIILYNLIINLQKENENLKEFKKEIVETVEQVSRNEYFYKYNNKYLRSELINEFQRIIDKY